MSDQKRPVLPYSRQLIEDDDVAAVAAVLRGDRLTTGPSVGAFEEAFATRVGARFGVSCANGTAGLHLAAMALNLRPEDAVVVPTLTFLATANSVRYVGAEVIFADVDPHTGLLTDDALDAALGNAVDRGFQPKAVFPVHLNGQCMDLAGLRDIAAQRNLRVVEDACHMLGGSYRDGNDWPPVGSCAHSDMAVFSLHPVKAITMGEGGVVTTGDEGLHDRLARLRNHGMVRDPSAFSEQAYAFDDRGRPNPWYYEMSDMGFNYRASDIQCALGLSQLGKLNRFNAQREKLVALYDEALPGLAPLVRPLERVPWCRPAWHLYVVHIDFERIGMARGEFMLRLREQGISTQVHYLPVHLQPYYRERYGETRLPGAEAYYAHALSLPLFPAMIDTDVDRVVAALTALCKT